MMQRKITAMVVAALATPLLLAVPARAAPPAPRPTAGPTAPADRLADPDHQLPPGWRVSSDRAVTSVGDDTGLHLLVASSASGYTWKTAVTLSEPGYATDQWVGQWCLTNGGSTAVVVYAPREFANRQATMYGGAFAATVDLDSGTVNKLGRRVTLAYYNPSCGSGAQAVVSRLDGDDAHPRTTAYVVESATGRLTRSTTVAGQVTSIVPVGDRLYAALGNGLAELGADGRLRRLADTKGTPYRIYPDGTDGVAFQVTRGDRTEIERYAGGAVSTVVSAARGDVTLHSGPGGRVFVGKSPRTVLAGALPPSWRAVDAPPGSDISTAGQLVVSSAHRTRTARPSASGDGTASAPVDIVAEVAGRGQQLRFTVQPPPAAVGGAARSPAAAAPSGHGMAPFEAPADESGTPLDLSRVCAVSRNDFTEMTYQPTPKQVEWAADLAVKGNLKVPRPDNWLNNGLPAYTPQDLFRLPPLTGYPDAQVPAQILLGVLAQESNQWQASNHVVDGSSGNFEQGGYYGNLGDPIGIDLTNADCGYGVAQVTTGMRRSDTNVVLSDLQQKAVALDYAANIAAGLQILVTKWNETRSQNMVVNNGDPRYVENWWYALWDYNTGFHARDPGAPAAPWGLGWLNNPANPIYAPDRQPFLTAPLVWKDADDEAAYDNSKHPNYWSYPERVLGWANTSQKRYQFDTHLWDTTYATAHWSGSMADAAPGAFTFCRPDVNQCDRNAPPHQPTGDYADQPPGPCQNDDLTACWWHASASWVDCPAKCGTETVTFTSSSPKPYANNPDPEQCGTTGLPAGAMVVDDVPATVWGPDACTPFFRDYGHFDLTFSSMIGIDGSTIYPSKADFHQIGGGFGGHFYFAHTYPYPRPTDTQPLKVTGMWTTYSPLNSWARVMVHVPSYGAETRQANYIIHEANTTPDMWPHRAIPTRYEANTWIDIGVYDFTNGAVGQVELSNLTADGQGTQDVAFDAVAFVPQAKPKHFVVAMGDSYSSGEGSGGYSYVSNQYGDDPANRNACRRGTNAWSRQIVLPGAPKNLGQLADTWDPNVSFQFIACSGARTHNVMNAAVPWAGYPPDRTIAGQYGELTQIDQGALNSHTTLVVLNIGGNDARFVPVLQACIIDTTDCAAPDFVLAGDDKPLIVKEPEVVQGFVKSAVAETINRIRAAAPNAWIVLAGYPRLFAPGCSKSITLAKGGLSFTYGLTADETAFINTAADQMATAVLVPDDRTHKIASVDVRNGAWAGHALCDDSEYANWLTSVYAPDDGGQDHAAFVGMGSFHPNASGQVAYGHDVSAKLATLGYVW